MNKFPEQVIPPILLVMVFDLVFTILGQPKGYWGNYSLVNEGSPLGFSLLSRTPFLFIVFFVFYLVVVYFLLKKLPIIFSLPLAITLFIGHVWGSSTWLPILYRNIGFETFAFYNCWLKIGYFIILAMITSFFILRVRKN